MSSAPAFTASRIRARIEHDASDPLLRSAYSLSLNIVVTSLLGFGFWVAAARLVSASTVGRDSALISAMITLSLIGQLNLHFGILRFLPIVKVDTAKAVIGAYVATAAVTVVIGTLFVLIAPDVTHNYDFLRSDVALGASFVAAMALWGIFALQDSVMTALRRAPWIPLENATFGVLKIAGMVVLFVLGASHPVFLAWVIPMALLLIPVNYLIFAKIIPSRPERGSEASPVERFGWSGLRRFFVHEYFAGIFMQATSTIVPVLVVGLLGTTQNAYFYVPFTIIGAFDLIFLNIASSLTVEGALSESSLPRLTLLVVRRFGAALIVGVAMLIAGTSLLLLPFGANYVHAGAPVLRLLACASAFRAIIALYVVRARIEGSTMRILAIQASTCTLVVTCSVVLGQARGIEGIAMAWLIANAVIGCVAAPRVLQTLRTAKGMV
jgi:O-antigen/teichoic acid export membrane protein